MYYSGMLGFQNQTNKQIQFFKPLQSDLINSLSTESRQFSCNFSWYLDHCNCSPVNCLQPFISNDNTDLELLGWKDYDICSN